MLILFLAGWYPSKVDPYNGDFIERHAKAISLLHQVLVIFVVKDALSETSAFRLEWQYEKNLVVCKAYYPPAKIKWKTWEKIHSNFFYFFLHQKIFRILLRDFGRPDLVHLNILMKAGMYAWWLKWRYHLPYVLSENWTGYYPENENGIFSQSVLLQKMTRKIYQDCSYALPVTLDLSIRLNQLFGPIPTQVISNVVDTQLFYLDRCLSNEKIKILHVSNFSKGKNIEGLVKVFKTILEEREDVELVLIGSASPGMLQMVKDDELLKSSISFTGILPYQEVAKIMQSADLLLMFSYYENLPCVILEALCCGLPVLSSDVGGIREVIHPGNGVLVPSGDKLALKSSLLDTLDKIKKFDRQKISLEARSKFSYHQIGKEFDIIYNQVLIPF
ncbi:MAG: glycosyltransferase [Chitinophagaceae bacterium]